MTTVALHPPQRLATGGASSPRTAFVLSGGASLGALQVGMLEALYERGITPDFLVGTSVGALNAAFVASRLQSPQTAAELGRVWHDLQRQDVFPLSMSALVGGVCGRRDHLVSDRELRRLIRRYIQFEDLTAAAIPLHLVAFDLIEGHELLLSEGPTVEAVAASASIPGIFPPVAIGQRRLIDGGVVNNTPISHAVELGAERIYVLPTQEPHSGATRVPTGARRRHPGRPFARGLSPSGRHREILGRSGSDPAPSSERPVRGANKLRALPPSYGRCAGSRSDSAP